MDNRDAEIIATLVEALASLNQRVCNVESLELIAGPQGEQGEAGPAGRDGVDAPPVTDEQIKDQAVAWLTANITQPTDGADGQDGRDADPITAEQIQLAVDLWFEFNAELVKGEKGDKGDKGEPGADGQDGRNGADGRNGVDGLNGSNGTDGIGIALVEQRDEKSFHITLDDGREYQIDLPEPKRTTVVGGGGGGGIRELVAGDGIAIDATDPKAPIISATGGGGELATYTAALSGFYFQVTQSQHLLTGIMIRVTRDADGALVSVADSIGLDGLVTIESNTSLSGHTLTIIGDLRNGS